MMHRPRGIELSAAALLALTPCLARAQQAMTVSGHVSAARTPIRGATVRIDELEIGATTNSDGRYAFIIPSTRVRGQKVQLSVSFPRYRKQSIEIELTGYSLVRDFELSETDAAAPRTLPRAATGAPVAIPSAVAPPATDQARGTRPSPGPAGWLRAATLDSMAFTENAGLVDLSSALTGRIAGLDVQTSSALGGTSSMIVRGPRSIAGLSQPLLVVDGVLADNSNITSLLQRSGLGGFDYGTTIGDLNLEDVAGVRIMSGPAAAAQYGGRAANGVILVQTKNARGLHGFQVSATQQISNGSVTRLPAFQNAYGQGSKGVFAFFDGKGGGINDITDESWGPALNGAPVLQASLIEAGRPDVRVFTSSRNNVASYYGGARTVASTIALQGGSDRGHFRTSFSNRLNSGITDGSSVTRRSAVAAGEARATTRLRVAGSLQFHSSRGEDRPGSGFDESNTSSTFSHMPRQIDVGLYKDRLRDVLGRQVSWNYSGRNNPWFAALENDNHDSRTRALGGGSATFEVKSWLTATAQGGADHSAEQRSFSIAPGWMGGFPYFRGRGDFSTGGFQNDDIVRNSANVEIALRATPKMEGRVAASFTAGVRRVADDLTVGYTGSDSLSATSPITSHSWKGSTATNALFGTADARVGRAVRVGGSVQREAVSPAGGGSASTFYPAVLGSVDLTRLRGSDTTRGRIESLVIHGGWSRSGNSATAALMQRLGFSGTTAPAPISRVASPEITTGWEAGVSTQLLSGRISLDVTTYRERSENLFIPDVTLSRTGTIANSGVEVTINAVPLRAANGLDWAVGGTFARNRNLVEGLSEGGASVALAPEFNGMSVVARMGHPLGALVGTRYLRDGNGQLLLRSGVPLADTVTGPVVLGSSMPDWTGGLSSAVSYRWATFSLLFDARHGGRMFSASNRAGAVAGVLEETAFRPDTGYLITGLDATSRQANITHATAEDYYHALGAIGERWVYDASYVKLRELRLSAAVPLTFIHTVRAQSFRLALIGRNLALWAAAPNIDPESVLSTAAYRGAEMGQLPGVRSIGFQLSLTP